MLRKALGVLAGLFLVVQYLVFVVYATVVLPLKFFGPTRRLFHAALNHIFNLTSTAVTLVAWVCGGVRLYRYGTMLPPHGTAPKRFGMLLFNHLSYTDAPMLGAWISSQPGVDASSMRWVSIRYLLKLPHGWLHWMRDDIFVGGRPKGELSERLDTAALLAGLERVADSDPAGPQWLFFAPEGSIQTPHLLKKSIEWANQKGAPPLQHLLLPRLKAFALACNRLKGMTDIFDATIGYPDAKRFMPLECLFGRRGGMPLHMHCRRIAPPQDTSDEALEVWLTQLFREKDALLEQLYTTGRFPDPIDEGALPRPIIFFWALENVALLFAYFWLLGGVLSGLGVAVGVALVYGVGLNLLLR